jgi:signal transduction histidine kinase
MREQASLMITIVAIALDVLLLALIARLIYADRQQRARHAAELREQNDRMREMADLSTYLQDRAEREKANLARELHDELGGLMVGARMDISWAQQHLSTNDADLKLRLNRVQQNLSAGVDLKRRIIEELRPTLLDNVGLFAALRWQLKETCHNAGLKCNEYYPEEEPSFTAQASIALFRIAQEAFTNIIRHSGAKAVDITLDTDEDDIVFRIADDGAGIAAGKSTALGSHGVASMRHRVRALGGRLEVTGSPAGGTLVVARIPASTALRPLAEAQPS